MSDKEKMNPKISVIVAAYGQEKYLDEALASLSRQTFRDWEAVIVDDGSPDGVGEIAAGWEAKDSRFRFLHTENAGVSAARNRGVAASSGEFLLMLDGDDILSDDYLELCLAAFGKNPSVRVVSSSMRMFGEVEKEVSMFFQSYPALLVNNPIHVTSMFRRADFDRVGGFDEKMREGVEDWEFWIRMTDGLGPENVFVHDTFNFFYRQKKTSRNVDASKKIDSCREYVFRKHIDRYRRYFGDLVRPWMLLTMDYNHYIAPLLRQDDADADAILRGLEHLAHISKDLTLDPELSRERKLVLLRGYRERWKWAYRKAGHALTPHLRRRLRLLFLNPGIFLAVRTGFKSKK